VYINPRMRPIYRQRSAEKVVRILFWPDRDWSGQAACFPRVLFNRIREMGRDP